MVIFFQNGFPDFSEMEVVRTYADSVFMTQSFDAHAAVLAVQYPILPLLQGDFISDFGDCCYILDMVKLLSQCSIYSD